MYARQNLPNDRPILWQKSFISMSTPSCDNNVEPGFVFHIPNHSQTMQRKAAAACRAYKESRGRSFCSFEGMGELIAPDYKRVADKERQTSREYHGEEGAALVWPPGQATAPRLPCRSRSGY